MRGSFSQPFNHWRQDHIKLNGLQLVRLQACELTVTMAFRKPNPVLTIMLMHRPRATWQRARTSLGGGAPSFSDVVAQILRLNKHTSNARVVLLLGLGAWWTKHWPPKLPETNIKDHQINCKHIQALAAKHLNTDSFKAGSIPVKRVCWCALDISGKWARLAWIISVPSHILFSLKRQFTKIGNEKGYH